MTYNLYYERTPPLKYIRTNVNEPYEQLKAVLEEMLAHPQILPDGGYLGFGLQRQYGLSEDTDLSTLVQNLKGSDALLMTVCDDLSIDVSVRMLYSGDDGYDVLAHQIYDIGHETVEEYPYADYIIQNDSEAFRVNTDKRDKDSKMPMIRWVVGNIKLGYVSQTISTYGNEPSLDQMYGHVCLIITIGPHGDRQNIDNLPQRDDDDNDYY
ncbi:hypothetical protein QCA50_008923 [Cerrena zonata]|uniref:Uncharacterized protein n=1 Tax=Cerrena zonata TaxID=2478898 RepID=A0AAW0G839_9APHY